MAIEATEVLADFAATLTYNDLPIRAREHCKNLILDALACAVAGHKAEETGQVAAFSSALAQSSEASVIGGQGSSLAGATLLNGYLVTAVTMCDVYRPTMTHVTPEVVPPALAIAERDNRSGRDLLLAIAAGCEVTTRVGLGTDYPAFRARGWHGPGVFGPFGAADTMARAFGLAGSQAAGTFAAWGTPTVKFHQCRGALSGLMAALLAREKFLATREFLTAKDGGLYNAYVSGGKAELAIAELGKRYELEQIALRLWPSASLIQGLNTALFDLAHKHKIDGARVRKIQIGLSKTAYDMHGGFGTYKGKFEALLSAHYTAAAIVNDRVLTLAQFEPERYNDPKLREFAANRVQVGCDPSVNHSQAKVNISMDDGTVLSSACEYPLGSFENPVSRAQVEEKFRLYAAGVIADANITRVIAAIDHLEDFGSVRQLTGLLRGRGAERAIAAAE